jgi:hypothetical protein
MDLSFERKFNVYATQQFLILVCAINHEFFVIASGGIQAAGGIMERGNPVKNTPQALLIYNAYLFFIWIATLHDSACGLNPSARNDEKLRVLNIKTMGWYA